jgi:hypothetical protein
VIEQPNQQKPKKIKPQKNTSQQKYIILKN